MYLGLALGAAATLPSVAAGSCRCTWSNYGQPFIHTTLAVDPSSAIDVHNLAVAGRISILDAWHSLWDPPSLANSFNMMMLRMPPSLTEWVTDSGVLNHTTPNPGNISHF
jgi:hypothetical protein